LYNADVLGDISTIHLTAGQNSFAFEYSALCYRNDNQLDYAFLLVGADDDWHFVGNRLYASYSNLAPGSYELRIKTRMAENAWPEQYTSVVIEIDPHWWQTWSFRILVLILLLGITILSIRLYTRSKLRKVQLELEKQKSIQQIRTRISRDIHDEIGAGLTKISLMSRKVVRESSGESAAAATAKNIAEASQQLVKNLGEIVWTINPKNDTLADFLGYVRSYCTALFDDSDMRLQLRIAEISQDARGWKLYPEVKRNLLLIIKETLNNTIKHSHAEEVELEIALHDHTLEVRIRDNGKGFDIDERGEAGNGLRNMKKRAEEIGAFYTIQAGSDGTHTTLRISLEENLL
jgi:signal transduction histidine kinase